MKKILFLLIFILSLSPLFSQPQNLISKDYIEYQNIDQVIIDLCSENLCVKKYKGEDILIEVYSNNAKTKPSIAAANNQLLIVSNNKLFSNPIYCNVEVYVPVNFIPDSIEINNIHGNTILENLKAKDSITFGAQDGECSFLNLNCENLELNTVSSDIKYDNLNNEIFFIKTVSGNIDVNLKNKEYVYSFITSEKGNIKVSYNKKALFDLLIYSEKPLTRNKNSFSTKLFMNPDSILDATENENLITIDTRTGSVELEAK